MAGPSAKTTQHTVEVVEGIVARAKVTQRPTEVLGSFGTLPDYAAVNGTSLSFPGVDTNTDTNLLSGTISRRNRLSAFFYPRPGSTVVIHVGASGALNDAGNVGVIAIDGTDDHSQAAPANSGNYTLTLSATNGLKAYFVYSFLTSSYRSGLTGSMTYDRTTQPDVTGVGVTQDVVEVLMGETPSAAITQDVVEVLMSGDGYAAASSGQHVSITIG